MSKKQKKNGAETPEDSVNIASDNFSENDGEIAENDDEISPVTESEKKNIEDQLAQSNERYVRLLAEYDNFRKRKAREMKEIIETATENLIIGFLPILDNMDRASEHMENQSIEEYAKGIKLVEEQMRQLLIRSGLEKMEVVGVSFDPAEHEAIMHMESDKYDSGVISAEVEKGYMLNGKIIRHPKVIVSK